MHKTLVTLVLIFALGTPGAAAYSHDSSAAPESTTTILNVTTTTTRSDIDYDTASSSTANPDILNPDILNPDVSGDSDLDGLTDGSEPEPTGIEHEDIGITGGDSDSGTSTSGQYNESDLNFVNRLIELGAVFVKIDDIKGKSDDSSSDGDPDRPLVTGSVYNNEGGSSDVIIKGKKILENDEIPTLLETAPNPEDVDTGVELALYGARVARDNSGFNEIRMNDSQVSIDYRHGLKLLGFIESTVPATVTITFGDGGHADTTDEFGRIKVQFPWWHVFGRKTVRPADISSAYDDTASDYDDFGRIIATREIDARNARALQILSGVMKNIHDPGITIIEI